MILSKLENEQIVDNCYGCYACANACPLKCIDLIEDIEGFRYPQVDENICNSCELCIRVCPIGKSAKDLHPKVLEKPEAYACYILDDVARKRSVSGGIAFAISQHVINQGGVVFGCVGSTLEHVHHTSAETIEELIPMCNSKYVQSDIGKTYIEAEKLLKLGRFVLFTGTPCQIAGLYSFLGKSYDNLTTCDLICHGVPSQKVLKAYIGEVEKKTGKKATDWKRTKINYFWDVQYIIPFNDGSYELVQKKSSLYRQGYSGVSPNLFVRKSCPLCEFSRIPRVSDFMLGDLFFGEYRDVLTRLDPNNNMGVSLITVNTEMGKRIFQEMSDSIYMEKLSFDDNNKMKCIHIPYKLNENRGKFFDLFHRDGFEKAAKKCIDPVRRKKRIKTQIIKLTPSFLVKMYKRFLGKK